MSGIFVFCLGLALLAIATYDFLYTAISLAGLGPISARLTRSLWRIGLRVTSRTERRFGLSLRGLIGPTILSALAATWIAFTLGGYILLYVSGPSLESSETHAPATFLQIIAFAGSALSTLGAATVQPTNGWWDLLSTLAAVNGMVVLTLSVTFVLNILQTTMSARSWAVRYRALLESADARGAARSPESVARLGADLCSIAVKVTSSPLTGFFVPNDPAMSFPGAVRDLCDRMSEKDLTSWSRGIEAGDLAQLRAGLGLLGRHVRSTDAPDDFNSAREWADRHSLRPRNDAQPPSLS